MAACTETEIVEEEPLNCKKSRIETVQESLQNFEGFCLKRILNENSSNKIVFLEGSFVNDGKPAVVILEKTPFSKEKLDYLLSRDTSLEKDFINDIYGSFRSYPRPQLNAIKTTIIHPATEKHIQKYSEQKLHLISETADMYKSITLPYLSSKQFSIQWVYNILEHKSEVERIICEDPDQETGFILIPDLKWDQAQTENLYLVAICHKRGLRSLRDLTAEHLPLLKNLRAKCLAAIEDKYQIPTSKLRVYLHYQPSYYHLHIHFTVLKFDAPGTKVEKAHLLDTVISNLELMSDYYEKVTLCYVLCENDELYERFQK